MLLETIKTYGVKFSNIEEELFFSIQHDEKYKDMYLTHLDSVIGNYRRELKYYSGIEDIGEVIETRLMYKSTIIR